MLVREMLPGAECYSCSAITPSLLPKKTVELLTYFVNVLNKKFQIDTYQQALECFDDYSLISTKYNIKGLFSPFRNNWLY